MAYLKGEERRAQILEGATRFFAEHGFSGQTRELSASLGITQPLLYRYFPSKQVLFDTIFEELFFNRWDPGWAPLVRNEAIPLEQRLTIFYGQFDERILTREWVRLFVFSGLSNYPYNQRVFRKLTSEIFRPLCVSLRKRHGLPEVHPREITRPEIEMAWELHGVVFYHRLRQYVYGVKLQTRFEEVIGNLLFYLEGAAPRLLEQLFPGQTSYKKSNGVKK